MIVKAELSCVSVAVCLPGVNFWDLGAYEQQFEAARQRALPALQQLLEEERRQADGAAADSRAGLAAAAS
jgi:hypothetical protein